MPFPFDKYPWLNFQELNLAYFIKHFREIFEQWNTLLNEMYEWKDATDAELEEWKSTVETGISSWETGLQQSMEGWKNETEADISTWEAATLSALDAWKTATTAVFEQIRTEAAASATAAAGSAADAQTALAGAQAAQAAAEAASAEIQSEAAQIQTNTTDITGLKAQISDTQNPLGVYTGALESLAMSEYEKGSINGTTGEDSAYLTSARARTKNLTTALYDFLISTFNDEGAGTNYAVTAYIYDGTTVTSSGPIRGNLSYQIHKGEVYRLLIRDLNHDTSADTNDLEDLVTHIKTQSLHGKAFPPVTEDDVGKVLIIHAVSEGVVSEYDLAPALTDAEDTGINARLPVFVDAVTGNDANAGTREAPFKSVNGAITAGHRTLRIAPGVYSEKVSLYDGILDISLWNDTETYQDEFRPKIEFIYGDPLTVTSAGDNIYQASYTANSGSNIYKVFVDHTLEPTTQGSYALEYNALLVGDKPAGSDGNKQRLYTPVLTETELSAEGTFWYDGTNHTIKIHPWNNMPDNAYYIPFDNATTIFNFNTLDYLKLEDVRIIGAYSDCAFIKKCPNTRIVSCEFGLCAKGNGLRINSSNVYCANTHTFGCSVDGFNLHHYGASVFENCTAFYCGDDGISHHDGCNGIVNGGEYGYNGSGGISPAFGATINISNAYCHHNTKGLNAVGQSGKVRNLKFTGILSIDNTTDISVKYYNVAAWNCIYETKTVDSSGTLAEYNNAVLT